MPHSNPSAAQPIEHAPFELAVVVPVHDEADNIRPLIEEIRAAVEGVCAYQIVYVDDGSTDATPQKLLEMAGELPNLTILRHINCCGQSAAVATGVAISG